MLNSGQKTKAGSLVLR